VVTNSDANTVGYERERAVVRFLQRLPSGRPLACTAYPKPNPFSPAMKVRACALVDGGDEHARTGRGDLLVIRGGRLALLGTQRSLDALTGRRASTAGYSSSNAPPCPPALANGRGRGRAL